MAIDPQYDLQWTFCLFFPACVIVAAIYSALTMKRSILLSQGGPALRAWLLSLLIAGAIG